MQRRSSLRAFGLLAALAAAVAPSLASAQAQRTVAYSGTAAADGFRIVTEVPGAPLTNTPLDLGGPTAQVAGDSLGSSTGYAAFPDPGPIVVAAPGLVVGLLGQGAAGLPPIELPSLPPYPLVVTSDAGNAPSASIGGPPVALTADSQPGACRATGTVGFDTGLGRAITATSTATLETTEQGATTTAIADIQGITIGPITIGHVRATAAMALDTAGTLTPTTSLEISALRIGGISVSVTPQGLNVGGTVAPLPIGPVLGSVLAAIGISMEIVAGQTFPDRVVAPALRITYPFAMPFAIPNLGQLSGQAVVTLGRATASMAGSVPPSRMTPSTPATQQPASTSGHIPPVATTPTGTGAAAAATPTAPSGSGGPSVEAVTPVVVERPLVDLGIDIRPVYAVIVGGTATAIGIARLLKRRGGPAWI